MRPSAVFSPATTAASTCLISLSVLCGWAFGIPILQTVLPGLISMKPNTALGFILSAITLWLCRTPETARHHRRLVVALAGATVAIGALTLLEYSLGLNPGIDELLFRDTVSPLYPGRMAPQTAGCFILVGIALMLADRATTTGRRPSDILALVIGAVALLAIIGYIYSVQYLYSALFVAMALHTSVNFLLLAIGILSARPETGLLHSLSGPHTGSFMARRLLPAAFLVPMLLGFIVLWGTRHWAHDASFWLSIHITGCILIDVFIVWWNAATLAKVDGERLQLVDDLRKALAIREEFLSIASHELRTPLTSAQLQFAVIDRRLQREELGDWVLPKLTSLRRQIGRLTRLVEELLDYTRISADRLSPTIEPIDVTAVVAGVVERYAADMLDAGCRVDLDLPPGITAIADASHLDQIVTNLLSNAVKFGRGKPIQVSLERETDRIRLTIRDQGIGIAPEQQAQLFGRFERLVSSRHYGGVGLGLWISRNLVEGLGGTITVTSQPGHGAAFTVLLPAIGSEEPALPGSPSVPVGSTDVHDGQAPRL